MSKTWTLTGKVSISKTVAVDTERICGMWDSIRVEGNTPMQLQDLYQNITLTEELALENYQQRNGVVDYKLPGVCNHYFAKYDAQGNRNGEVCLTCKVSKTVKGQLRYTFQIDGKRVSKGQIDHSMIHRGAIEGYAPGTYF